MEQLKSWRFGRCCSFPTKCDVQVPWLVVGVCVVVKHQRFLPTTPWTMGCIFQKYYFHSNRSLRFPKKNTSKPPGMKILRTNPKTPLFFCQHLCFFCTGNFVPTKPMVTIQKLNKHSPWKVYLPNEKGSSSNFQPSFSGSMLNFGGVWQGICDDWFRRLGAWGGCSWFTALFALALYDLSRMWSRTKTAPKQTYGDFQLEMFLFKIPNMHSIQIWEGNINLILCFFLDDIGVSFTGGTPKTPQNDQF